MSTTDTDYQVGELVNVEDDHGVVGMYEVKYPPWQLGDGRWVIGLRGITGGYALDRVRKIRPLGRVAEQRVAELQRERDAYRQCLEDLVGHLDYLQDLWGAEGVTRRVLDNVRECLKGESEAGE